MTPNERYHLTIDLIILTFLVWVFVGMFVVAGLVIYLDDPWPFFAWLGGIVVIAIGKLGYDS